MIPVTDYTVTEPWPGVFVVRYSSADYGTGCNLAVPNYTADDLLEFEDRAWREELKAAWLETLLMLLVLWASTTTRGPHHAQRGWTPPIRRRARSPPARVPPCGEAGLLPVGARLREVCSSV